MAQQISALGIDIAKLVFHVVGMDDTGHVVLRKCLARSELLPFIAQLSPLRIGMEACGQAISLPATADDLYAWPPASGGHRAPVLP
jgi:hypothetical protein